MTVDLAAAPPTGIEDVPDAMARVYLAVLEFAHSTPQWVQTFVSLFTEISPLLLLGLLSVTFWKARDGSARTMALALLVPVGLLISYLVSEWAKTVVEVERPCRTLAVRSLIECPANGDWSLPSNHAAIAGALSLGILIARPRLGVVAAALGGLTASARVFVGVHYPHDVIIGFLLGAGLTAIVMLVGIRPAAGVVVRLRRHDRIGSVFGHRSRTSLDTSRSSRKQSR